MHVLRLAATKGREAIGDQRGEGFALRFCCDENISLATE